MLVLSKVTPIAVSVAQVSIEILPANSRRMFAEIVNPTANGIWLGFGVAPTVGTGGYVPAGGSYIIDKDNLWRGAVNGISGTGTNVISVTDFQ